MTIITYVAVADDAVTWGDIFQLSAISAIKIRISDPEQAGLPSAASQTFVCYKLRGHSGWFNPSWLSFGFTNIVHQNKLCRCLSFKKVGMYQINVSLSDKVKTVWDFKVCFSKSFTDKKKTTLNCIFSLKIFFSLFFYFAFFFFLVQYFLLQ